MKLLLPLIFLGLVGCGFVDQRAKECGGDYQSLCEEIFGRTNKEQQGQIDQLQARVNALEVELGAVKGDLKVTSSLLPGIVSSMETNHQDALVQIASLQTQLSSTNLSLQVALGDLAGAINAQQDLEDALGNVTTVVAGLQVQNNNILVQLAVLQGYTNIVGIKDPCGKQSSYDEVFLKLSNGKYLASFSENISGKNTRFTVLTDGSFRTTDATNCHFTVSAGGTVISGEHN